MCVCVGPFVCTRGLSPVSAGCFHSRLNAAEGVGGAVEVPAPTLASTREPAGGGLCEWERERERITVVVAALPTTPPATPTTTSRRHGRVSVPDVQTPTRF